MCCSFLGVLENGGERCGSPLFSTPFGVFTASRGISPALNMSHYAGQYAGGIAPVKGSVSVVPGRYTT